MRRSSSSESPQGTDVEYLLDVVDRHALDEEHQALHPKPWMTVSPSGAIQYFDTEEQACEAQRQGGPAYSDVPVDIQSDLSKVFARLGELGYKSFALSYQEGRSDATCSVSLSKEKDLSDAFDHPASWAEQWNIEVPALQGEPGAVTLESAMYDLGERIAEHLFPGSSEWDEGRVVNLDGLLDEGGAGVRVELLEPVEREEYLPFVLEEQSEELRGRLSRLAAALREAGVSSLQASYDGGGDEGAFEEISLFDAEGDSLDDEVEETLAESLGEDSMADALWPVLADFAGRWEDNNGSRGELIINASGDVSIDHYDREDGLDSIKLVNWRVEAVGAPQVQLDSAPEM